MTQTINRIRYDLSVVPYNPGSHTFKLRTSQLHPGDRVCTAVARGQTLPIGRSVHRQGTEVRAVAHVERAYVETAPFHMGTRYRVHFTDGRETGWGLTPTSSWWALRVNRTHRMSRQMFDDTGVYLTEEELQAIRERRLADTGTIL